MIGCRYFMNVLKHCSASTLILCIALLLIPFSALAEICAPVETSQKTEDIEDAFRCDPALTGITFRMTECVKAILTNVAEKGFTKVLAGLKTAIFATMTMFVAFTGIKMILGGVRNIKGEALLMLVKLAVVMFVVAPSGDGVKLINNLVNGITSGMVDAVSSNLVSSGPCSTTVDSTGAAIVEKNVWKRIDCTILVFIGKRFASGVATGPKDLNCDGDTADAGEQNVPIEDAALFEIGLSQLFTPHGIFILFLLVAAIATLFLAFARVLQIYVIAFIAITFLMLFAPIFFPLMLFQRTKRMFQTWLFMIIGYALQPAMVVAFLAFFLSVMNVAIHGQYNTAVPPVLISPGLKTSLDLMNSKMQANQCTRKPIAIAYNEIMQGKVDTVFPAIVAAGRKFKTEASTITAPTTPVPYTDLSVFMVHLIGCVVLLFIMMGLFANVADFVASLSGGVGGNLAKMGGGMEQLGGAARDAARQIVKE